VRAGLIRGIALHSRGTGCRGFAISKRSSGSEACSTFPALFDQCILAGVARTTERNRFGTQ